MIQLGKYQTLEVIKKTDFGFYLAEPESDGKHTLLLPQREAPEETKTGDMLEVFVYKDSEDREITTTTKVPLEIGGLAVLKVKEVSKVGAFLDWGLMKDLLLPYKEQTTPVKDGDQVLVTLYADKSSRLCASMKVYDILSTSSPYQKDDTVTGTIYDKIDTFGIFVAVDNLYSAMIPKNEQFRELNIGDEISGRVINVREDGKLTLSLREKSHIQMDTDSEMIMNRLKAANGFLPYNDSTNADIIKKDLEISKNAFKRAIGKLYKAGSIAITDDGIRIIQ